MAAVLLFSIFTEQFKWGKLEGVSHISHCHDGPESAVSLTTFIIFCLQSTRNQKNAKCVTQNFSVKMSYDKLIMYLIGILFSYQTADLAQVV